MLTGSEFIGNQTGVLVYNKYATVTNNIIGGTNTEARNIISGNITGITISSGTNNKVEGNFIGTDISGANSVPNSSEGIHLIGGSFNTIGGTTSGSGNIISGNKGSGIEIEFTYDNLIEGNLIGIQFDAY